MDGVQHLHQTVGWHRAYIIFGRLLYYNCCNYCRCTQCERVLSHPLTHIFAEKYTLPWTFWHYISVLNSFEHARVHVPPKFIRLPFLNVRTWLFAFFSPSSWIYSNPPPPSEMHLRTSAIVIRAIGCKQIWVWHV